MRTLTLRQAQGEDIIYPKKVAVASVARCNYQNRAWLTEVRQRGPFHYRWHLNNSPMTAEPYRAKELPLHMRRSCFAPTETHLKKVGLWWRRRVLPPGP